MFGLSFEHILIFGVVLLIFGPKRLPELGQSLGKGIKNFKDSFNGVQEVTAKKIEQPVQSNPVQSNADSAGATALSSETATETAAETATPSTASRKPPGDTPPQA